MKKNIFRVSLFSLLSLMLLSISAMAQATSTTTTDRISMSGTFIACNGEVVPYEGTQKTVVHINVSSSGQVNVKVGIQILLKGVGPQTGARYIVNGTLEEGVRFDGIDNAPYNATLTRHININGQGNVPNTKIRVLAHVTINANGDITSTKTEMSTECNP